VFVPSSSRLSVPVSPFIVSKERARVIFVIQKMKWGKDEREKQKGGLGCGRLPLYPVGAVPL
jgi:hypothetical protein